MLCVGLVCSLLLAAASPARADAIMGPPECPPGKVPVSDHRGQRCEDPPPSNCPPGWRGATGGTCRVATCSADDECGGGVCTEQTVCVQRERGGRGEEYDETIGIVGNGAVCEGPGRRSEQGKVCVRQGETVRRFVPPGAPHKAGCNGGCDLAARAGGGGGLTALAALSALLLARRRRRG